LVTLVSSLLKIKIFQGEKTYGQKTFSFWCAKPVALSKRARW